MSQSSFLHKVFCDISLEEDPDLWQNNEDTEGKNIDRIRLISGFEQTLYSGQLNKEKSTNRKNASLCSAMKEKGNKSYGAGDNLCALTQYNQALMFSSKPEDTALILANRSALWFDMGEHSLVERDIDLAIRTGYPVHLMFKLFERRAKARFALNKIDLAKQDLHEAIQQLETSRLDKTKIKNKKQEFKAVLAQLEKTENRTENKNEVNSNVLPTWSQTHPRFTSLSDSVSIRWGEGRGRYAVATRDIQVGDLIADETAFVAQIDKEFSKTHCWNCLTCAKCPLPCESCSGVIFCSESCRDTAMSSYHPYECLFTDVLFQANLGAWRLGYRALTSRPWSYFKENIDIFLGRNELAGVEGDAVFSSQDILSFHSLVTHDGLAVKQAPELMMQAHVVVFLIRVLHASGYLSPGQGGELSEDDLQAGRILHHFMRAAFYNTHETTQIRKTGSNWENNKIERIGRVTNPTLALINHSCDPNYRRVSTSTRTFGFACKHIRKGEEISDLYSKPFSSSDAQSRQASLSKYNFNCGCRCCVKGWPTLGNLPDQLEGLPPKFYKLAPNKIDSQIKRILRREENLRTLEKKENGSLPPSSSLVSAISSVLTEHSKLLEPPHQLLVYWENKLHHCLLHEYASKVATKSLMGTDVFWPCTAL